jgi:nitrite reductase (NADH) small subunit
VAKWVRLCAVADAPKSGRVREAKADGVDICLANVNGELAALCNWCPHAGGSLGQGMLQGGSVVCPWHGWTFDLKTGDAEAPVADKAHVIPLRVEGNDILADIG